jgi:hypothetical protein
MGSEGGERRRQETQETQEHLHICSAQESMRVVEGTGSFVPLLNELCIGFNGVP